MMNKLTKTTILATALFASAPLFANTTATHATASVQATTHTELAQTQHAQENKGLLKSLNQGVTHTANSVGTSVENGVDNTKQFTKDKWQDSKKFTAEKTQSAKEKTQLAKVKAAEQADKAKKVTQDKLQKAKAAMSPVHKPADLSTNSQAELNSPLGHAKVDVKTSAQVEAE